MKRMEITQPFTTLLESTAQVARSVSAKAVLLLVDNPFDFAALQKQLDPLRLIVASDSAETQQAAKDDGIQSVALADPEDRRQQLNQALLEAIADEFFQTGDTVVVLYPNVDSHQVDTLTVVRLDEHLSKLTSRDLQRLETQVPLETLRQVVSVAVEIGRDGREGKQVGTLFVVGNHRKVLAASHEQVHDPFRGYSAKERQIRDQRVRESVKEIAQLDGAFIIAADGTVISAGRHLDAAASGINVSKGLGARHWAAAAISKSTGAVAIAVSESTGTVRIFQDGKIVLRIEPMGRGLKWRTRPEDGSSAD